MHDHERATLCHEAVRQLLRGKESVRQWENVQSLTVALVELCDRPHDEDAEVARLRRLWDAAFDPAYVQCGPPTADGGREIGEPARVKQAELTPRTPDTLGPGTPPPSGPTTPHASGGGGASGWRSAP